VERQLLRLVVTSVTPVLSMLHVVTALTYGALPPPPAAAHPNPPPVVQFRAWPVPEHPGTASVVVTPGVTWPKTVFAEIDGNAANGTMPVPPIVPLNVGEALRTTLPVPVVDFSPRMPPLLYWTYPFVPLAMVVAPTVNPETAGVAHVGTEPAVGNVKNCPDVQAALGVVRTPPSALVASPSAVSTPVPVVAPDTTVPVEA
jgi:hypothetical protein